MDFSTFSNDELVTDFVIRDYAIKNYKEDYKEEMTAEYMWDNLFNQTDRDTISASTNIIFHTKEA